MTRNGKIARLPGIIRNELNQRLSDGEPGNKLVEWLNGNRFVKTTLKEEFAGRPITEQNLSEWKQGGYQDWLRYQESCAIARDLLDEEYYLKEEMGYSVLTDGVSNVVALTLAKLLKTALAQGEQGPKQCAAALEIVRELARWRNADHEMERRNMKCKEREDKAEEAEEKRTKGFQKELLADLKFGMDLKKAVVKSGKGVNEPGFAEEARKWYAANAERLREAKIQGFPASSPTKSD